MALQNLLNSRRAGKIALAISHSLPPAFGLRLADFIADRLAANRQLPMIQGIRLNQWMISQQSLTASQLDLATHRVMRNIARSFYYLFHNIDQPAGLEAMLESSPALDQLIRMSHEKSRGVIVAGVHMSSFDLALQAALSRGLRAVTLTLPHTTQAIDWQHTLRRKVGLEVLPLNLSCLRQTIRRLQAGEIFITGLDRPVGEAVKHPPCFFGHPADVPIHYVQMALAARAQVIVMAAVVRPDGRIHILASDFLEMRPHPDRETEIFQNAEMILGIATGFIRQAPQQWAIFQPVWPQKMGDVPKIDS